MAKSILQFWKNGFNGKAYGGIVMESDFSIHIKDLEKYGCKVVGIHLKSDRVEFMIDKPPAHILSEMDADKNSKFEMED